MKRITQYITNSALAFVAILGLAAMVSVPAFAGSPASQVQDGINAAGANNAGKTCGPEGNKRACSLGDRIGQVINVLLFIIGAIAVIMIILGGIRYTISNGDSSQITSAKNTVLYAVIGLVVALLAYAIVNFVVTQFA